MPEGVIKYLTSEIVMRGLQKFFRSSITMSHCSLESVFRALGHHILKQSNSASDHTKHQVLQTTNFGIFLRWKWFLNYYYCYWKVPAASSLSHLLSSSYHVHMITDAPSFMTSAHPIPASSQSHSERGFCVLLKSLKHLFPAYTDTRKRTSKGTGLQSYQVPKRALPGCGKQSQPLNHVSAWAGIASFSICSFVYQASGSQAHF